MSVTDKELLAICNLSNLKMEFANLKKDQDEIDISQGDTGQENNGGNHTISNLLENEIEGIKKEEQIINFNKILFL